MRASERIRRIGASAILLGLTVLGADASAQQSREDAEARLRSALRNTTVQLRQMEDQFGALQAKQAEMERERQALGAKLEEAEKELSELRRRLKNEEAALEQSSARLRTAGTALDAERARLAKSQAAYQEAAQAARVREAEIKRLDATLAATRKRALAAEAKNADLYRVGLDLIGLYERKSLLEALVAREPVTRLKQVELDNLMQNYKDKLSDARTARPQPQAGERLGSP